MERRNQFRSNETGIWFSESGDQNNTFAKMTPEYDFRIDEYTIRKLKQWYQKTVSGSSEHDTNNGELTPKYGFQSPETTTTLSQQKRRNDFRREEITKTIL